MKPGLRSILPVAGLIVLAGCSKGALPPTGGAPALPAAAPGTDVISTFQLVGHTDAGRKKWEVQGETADLMSEIVELSPVRATSYGQTEIKLSAQRGRFNKNTQNVFLFGDVVVTTTDGAELSTQSLNWVESRGEGSTEDWVRVTQPGMTALGLGGTGYPKNKRVWLERKVTVTLEDPKGKTVITCDGPMEVDYGRHKARFWKNVKVVDVKGEIRSDRLDVTFDSQTNRMDKAVFWGHVVIDHGDEKARANRVNYWQLLERIQLIGHPRLVLTTDALE
jgi:LPS export ABC transporter protein LptC